LLECEPCVAKSARFLPCDPARSSS
jgi:hypothetical protein